MIVEIFVISGALSAGFAVFRHQGSKKDQRTLNNQRRRAHILKTKSGVGLELFEHKKPGAESSSGSLTEKNDIIRQELALVGTAIAACAAGALFYAPLAIAAGPILIFVRRRYMAASIVELFKGRIGVELLSTVSMIGAILTQHYFVTSLLVLLFIIGEKALSQVIDDSKDQLLNVFNDLPKTVWLLKDGAEISTRLDDIEPGDILVVSAGEVIPVDGRIVSGAAGVDEHRLTGEAAPVEKGEKDQVFAMTLVLSGKIQVRVDKAGAETSAMQISQILTETADYKSSTVLEAQALSQNLVAPAFVSAAVMAPVLGPSAAVALLFAHPKERLLLSAPISLMKYLRHATKEGVLIKDGRSLELLNKVDAIVFDKTGTLTEETPHVGEIHCFSAIYDEQDVLSFAAAAEHRQAHPVAKAILNAAAARDLPERIPEHCEYRLGYGIQATIGGQTVLIGSARFMSSAGVETADTISQLLFESDRNGYGVILVALDNELIGALVLHPTLRPEAQATIQALREHAKIKQISIISGDREGPTAQLANSLNLDSYFAQVLPEGKAQIIEQLQNEGRFVCFIGDGVNDAIAMKQAQVSISLSGASQLATDTAQIVLLDGGIGHLPYMFEVAKGFKRHMRRQFSVILAPSLLGALMVAVGGWGVAALMYLNMSALSSSVGNALLDRPPQPPAPNNQSAQGVTFKGRTQNLRARIGLRKSFWSRVGK